jgi:hypothetical protein
MSWCLDAAEDEAISLFAELLANPDMRLSHTFVKLQLLSTINYRHSVINSWLIRSWSYQQLLDSLNRLERKNKLNNIPPEKKKTRWRGTHLFRDAWGLFGKET